MRNLPCRQYLNKHKFVLYEKNSIIKLVGISHALTSVFRAGGRILHTASRAPGIKVIDTSVFSNCSTELGAMCFIDEIKLVFILLEGEDIFVPDNQSFFRVGAVFSVVPLPNSIRINVLTRRNGWNEPEWFKASCVANESAQFR